MHACPSLKPARPFFSSGPTVKHPGWSQETLSSFLMGRSHRAPPAVEQIEHVVSEIHALLEIPDDYKLVLLPGSATGAMGAALWNFLGLRGLDAWIFDLFGARWLEDVREQLRFLDLRAFEASFGEMPDLSQADFDRDQLFVWNGTTSGVWLQNMRWIDPHRTGLTICDATSAVLCADLPWSLLDVTAFSWQKGFGGEAGVGMLVLSPRAMEQLRDYTPPWPIPRTLSLKIGKKIRHSLIDEAVPLNTLSMMSVADMLSSLAWVRAQGGLHAMIARVDRTFGVIEKFVSQTSLLTFTVKDKSIRSHSSVCLDLLSPDFCTKTSDERWNFLRKISILLGSENVAFDFLGHALSSPCLRFWCGPTVAAQDMEHVLPWVEWGIEKVLGDVAPRRRFLS